MNSFIINGKAYSSSINIYSFYNASRSLNITTPELIENVCNKVDLEAIGELVYWSIYYNHREFTFDEIYNMDLLEVYDIVTPLVQAIVDSLKISDISDKNNNSSSKYDESDWDYEHFEYIHISLLGRSEESFWGMTPKKILNQFDIYCKMNGLQTVEEQKPKVEEKYIDEL